MKRWILVLFAALLFAITAGCTKEPSPEERFAKYIDLWNKQQFDQMYGYLSAESKKSISKQEFVGRYQKIYKDLQIDGLKVEYKRPKKDAEHKGDQVGFTYKAHMNSIAGEINFSQKANLKKEEQSKKTNWFVQWDTTQIFPQLKEGDKIALTSISPKRGIILDRKGNGLATNGQAYELGIVPQELGAQKEQTIIKLSQLLKISPEQINKTLGASWVKPEYFVPLKKVALDDQALLHELMKLPPVHTKIVDVRIYPYKEAAAQLIGYVGEVTGEDLANLQGHGYSAGDIIGKRGLEQVYEEQLRGKSGVKITIKKKNGTEEVLAEKPVEDGKEIKTTIDGDLQLQLFSKLAGKAGASAALNPMTGETLALVSSPAFDPNKLTLGLSASEWKALEDNPQKPLLTRFKQAYAPGSTMKPITAGIALTNNAINPAEAIAISGKQWQKDPSWGSYYVTRVHQSNPVNLEKALVFSDNIYFAQTALKIGKENFASGLKNFGFESDLGFPFPLQASKIGNLSSEISLADSGYGQGQIQMSLLHLMSSYTPFVNGGNMIKPVLLLDDPKSQIQKEQVISKAAVDTIAPILRKIVSDPHGTAHAADIPGYPLAGKTGTAELKAKQGEKGVENGWFVAYNTNNPNLMIGMFIEGVQSIGGSQVPVRLVKAIYTELHH
ncbi:MAG: penicillin-binding transpeptidase domain-containing protein [Bacillota bacterium]|nr:penicillin-binding transpeptidase domain-containing protein [Bacillota bacterium]